MSRAATTLALRPMDLPDDRMSQDIMAPHGADDRAYLVLMYEQHASQARQQENFRTVWAAVTAVLLPVLLLAALDRSRQFACGILICVTALVGLLMQGKHQDRHDLHMRVMRGFRGALATAVRKEIPAISHACRMQHNREFRPFRFVGVGVIWGIIYIAAFAAGATLAGRGEIARLFGPDPDGRAFDTPSTAPVPLTVLPGPASIVPGGAAPPTR